MSCIFCEISQGKKQADIIYKDSDFLVFKDINPHAPTHLLIIPRIHIDQPINNQIDHKTTLILGRIFFLAKKIAQICNIENSGWRLVQNNGRDPGQVIDHFHVHLMGGKKMKL